MSKTRTVSEAAKEFGCSIQTLAYHCHKMGVPKVTEERTFTRTVTAFVIDEVTMTYLRKYYSLRPRNLKKL